MNNPRLLTGWLAALLSAGVCASAQKPAVYTLDKLFEIAESNSVQMRPAFSAEMQAQADVDVARMNRLPDISASLSLSFIGDGVTTKRDFSDCHKAAIPHFGNSAGLRVSQPVYAGGAITNGIELAELKLTATRYAMELRRDNIRFRLAGFYLDIYKYTNLRSVVEHNIGQARQVLRQMHARHEQGMALQNDITRYELLVSNLELQLVKINNTLDILNTNLARIAGLPSDTKVLPDTTILEQALPKGGEEAWQAEAAMHSPSIKLAQSECEISRKSEALARAGKLPKIGLQAGWTLEGPILVEVPPINRNLSYWYVGVGISYNISSLFKTDKSLRRSRAAIVHADDELAAARESTALAIGSDYVRYLEAYEELSTQEKSVELARRNYDVIFTRYSAGMALVTDMLDAANSVLDAEQRLVNARIDIVYYYYKLLFTSGRI